MKNKAYNSIESFERAKVREFNKTIKKSYQILEKLEDIKHG